ncbi:MAG: esterase-like activity of phytase family protein [Candidatus Competibacteraceae bacterium]
MSRSILILLLILSLSMPARAAREFDATPISLADHVDPGETYGSIRLLSALRLARAEFDGLRLCGLSGLAWDENAGLLYAISDSGGLFHLRPAFDDRGHLAGARVVAAYPLRDAAGKPLRSPYAAGKPLRSPYNDAEGLALRGRDNPTSGEPELVISFEIRPRVVRYTPTGRWLGEEPLPALLREVHNYRDRNQALEAVTLHPRWGVLVGPEQPLRRDPAGQIRLSTHDGRYWFYPLGTAPGAALVAMEALPDGGLLTLERAFVAPLRPLIISLRRTVLPAPSRAPTPLRVADVAIFDSTQGWLLDNFEGLSRHQNSRFFIISDDNCNRWQTTLLVYFELLPTPAGADPG